MGSRCSDFFVVDVTPVGQLPWVVLLRELHEPFRRDCVSVALASISIRYTREGRSDASVCEKPILLRSHDLRKTMGSEYMDLPEKLQTVSKEQKACS